jgi:hypothetical protein
MTGDAWRDPTEVHRDRRGPRWLPILGVVVGVGVVAAVAIPRLRGPSSVYRNDTAALATLRNLASVQEQFRDAAAVDVDGDGRGEFGTLGEMTGAAGLRRDASGGRRDQPLDVPMLSPSLANVSNAGIVTKAGYAFAVFLPAPGGRWIRERGGAALRWSIPPRRDPPWTPGDPLDLDSPWPGEGPPDPRVAFASDLDVDAAEIEWLAVAWPFVFGQSGQAAFLVTSAGDVYRCPNTRARWSGSQSVPFDPARLLPTGWRPGRGLGGRAYATPDGDTWAPCR